MSYYDVLGLEKEPFSTSPDPAFFYRSAQHRSALANLLIELRLRRGLSVVLGNIGTGKTTLGRKLIQMLKERDGFLFHIILNPVYRTEELFFDALIRRFGIELPEGSKTMVDYWEVLEKYLYQKGVEEKQTVVLVIDEAHKLNHVCLEGLRVLLNYETNDTKLLQLVLLGQMELLPMIKDMPNLNDRISMNCILQPLALEEIRQLIDFRMQEAGYQSSLPLFTNEAVEMIHRHTQGYPRRIASVCHRALRWIVMKQQTVVQGSTIEEVMTQERESGWTPKKILQKSSF